MSNYTEKNYDISENNYWKGTVEAPNKGYPKNYFYAGTLRNISIAFTNFFNDLYVVRYNEYGEPVKNIQVPIKFGPRMKSFDFRKELESGKTYYVSYPNLAWRFESFAFDADRYSGQFAERVFYNDTLEEMGMDYTMSDKFWSDVQPVPYSINISMELKCDLLSDATQVIEQICSRFTPDNNLNIKEFWFFNKRRSIAINLEGAPSMQIESESMGEEDKREITVSFSFKIDAYLYKPIKRGAIIDKINTYLQTIHSTEVWHHEMFGDYDGTTKDRYDFEDLYGCKVQQASALAGPPEQTWHEKEKTWVTTYTYKATGDYTFYPAGTRMIKDTSAKWNNEKNEFDIINTYYDVGAYGESPIDVNIKHKTLYDSYGSAYSGYYVQEVETISGKPFDKIYGE